MFSFCILTANNIFQVGAFREAFFKDRHQNYIPCLKSFLLTNVDIIFRRNAFLCHMQTLHSAKLAVPQITQLLSLTGNAPGESLFLAGLLSHFILCSLNFPLAQHKLNPASAHSVAHPSVCKSTGGRFFQLYSVLVSRAAQECPARQRELPAALGQHTPGAAGGAAGTTPSLRLEQQ